jgi:hypothetical protein
VSRPKSLWDFLLRSILWFALLLLLWLPIAKWTSYPAAELASRILGGGASEWVEGTSNQPGLLSVDTRIVVVTASGTGRATLDIDTIRYAYSLPLLISLLLAGGCRKWLSRSMIGYFALVPVTAFCICMNALKQIMVLGGSASVLGVSAWQMELIAFGYQFAVLLLPSLAPIVLWFGMDSSVFAAVIVAGWLARRVVNQRDDQPPV